jgi:biotin carboxyl carrier protein
MTDNPREECAIDLYDLDDTDQSTDGGAGRVGVRRLGDNELLLRMTGGQERVTVVRTETGAWVWHEGRARFVEDSQGPRRPARTNNHVPGAVTPPMPATVVRILVQVGDEVDQGQALVVVSAMKMEATLSSPHKGVVREIHTSVGATVRPGEILVDVAPAS